MDRSTCIMRQGTRSLVCTQPDCSLLSRCQSKYLDVKESLFSLSPRLEIVSLETSP